MIRFILMQLPFNFAAMKQFYPSRFVVAIFICALLHTACNHPSSPNKFADPELLKLAEFTDQRNADSVIAYLTNPQPMLRVEAAFALASMREPRAVDALHISLRDAIAEVRSASAYALGQTLHPSSIEPLALQLLNESDPASIIALAEAIGKIAGGLHASSTAEEWVENAANAIFNYERVDSIGVHATAKAAFWMHNSGWGDTRLINKLATLYPSQSTVNRRMIAYAMGRYRGAWYADTVQVNQFIASIANETDTLTLTAAMPVAGRSESGQAQRFIERLLRSTTTSQELLVAVCRAAGKHPQVSSADLLPLLQHPRRAVAEEACLALQSKKLLAEEIAAIRNVQTGLSLAMQAATTRLLHLQGDSLRLDSWLATIERATTAYDRLACIRVLGVSGISASTCLERALTLPDILQANAYTEAFIETHNQPNFPDTLNYANAMRALLMRADIGITALCAVELREEELIARDKLSLNDVLLQALSTLSLPKEIETANEIIRTLNGWGISPREEVQSGFNHPIDWDLVKTIPRRQRARIETTQGTIEIELHVEEAPGSVASFVSLCKTGFYNGKTFHRVVPNFVAQGGCPRGDGMGGTEYTLRSEFRLHDYRTGSVGLASSGPDTESCQWFITHVPTPHLEGRYTIFAHVVKGMEIVQFIEVGDTIHKVTLVD